MKNEKLLKNVFQSFTSLYPHRPKLFVDNKNAIIIVTTTPCIFFALDLIIPHGNLA